MNLLSEFTHNEEHYLLSKYRIDDSIESEDGAGVSSTKKRKLSDEEKLQKW
jgi:hypothetical protein